MTTENTGRPIDLDVDFSQVDTSYPLLPESFVKVKIVEAKAVDKKEGPGRNLKIVVQTVNTETSVKAAERGEVDDVKPGLKLTAYHPLQDKDGNGDNWKKNIATLLEAATGSKATRLSSENLEGRELLVRLGHETYEGSVKNTIKTWKQAD